MENYRLEIDGQTVIFGDSRKMISIEDQSVAFIVTSPPYWDLKKYGGKGGQIGDGDYSKYLSDLNEVWAECYRVAREDAVMVVNVNSRRRKKRFYPIAFDIYKEMRDWVLWDVLIWYIPNALPQPNSYRERLFDNKFEYLLVFLKGNPDRYYFKKPRVPQKYIIADPRSHKKNAEGRCLGNIIRIPAYRPPNVKQLGYHEAAFPEELVAVLMESFTKKGDTVLDPFLGSGTTLNVARSMNRTGIGFELNEGYSGLIRERILSPWQKPDWKKIDLIHSTTAEPGMRAPRKIHLLRQAGMAPFF